MTSEPSGVRWSRVAFWGLVILAVAARVAAIFTENINWDEFALLHRAELSARTGQVIGGGRPGLATLLLLPLAAACRDAVDALIQARIFWTGIVLASAIAFWVLLRLVLPQSPYRWAATATGVALWVLAPPFLRFSTQVRTDQPAVLFGLLGGAALVSSRRKPWLALLAGLLFGIGFLFTQKLLYVAALVGVLAAGQMLIRGEWQTRRDIIRAVLASAAFLIVVVTYRQLMGTAAGAPAMLPVSDAMSTFEHYREAVGWDTFVGMLPSLIPQQLVLLFLPIAAIDWLRRRGPHGRQLGVALAVLVVGTAVTLFHAARFPYFYIVLGLFPATIGALILGPVMQLLESARSRYVFLAVIWTPLALLALLQADALVRNTQVQQHESLSFVERNFPQQAHGFNSRAAFACRGEASPFPVWFHEHLRSRFETEPAATENTRWVLNEFRSRPVAFMIPPLPWEPYPRELWRFWATRYVHYTGAVHVAGRQIRGQPGATGEFEVIVPGEYVWRTTSLESGALEIEGRAVEPGATITLPIAGIHRLALPAGGEGMIVLALPEPPAPDPRSFYTGW